MTHAILSPSSASRWLACPPSARFEEQIPGETSPYAEEGTLAHELAALLLSARAGIFVGGQEAFNEALARVYGHPLFANEMYDHADEYATLVAAKGGKVLVEHRYDLTRHAPMSFGTADATNLLEDAVHVTDFKYGAGVRVTARENEQLMLYALGAIDEARARRLNPSTAVLTIVQPRAGGTSAWEVPVADLLAWREVELRPRALDAIAGGGTFTPGDHCRFCKARARCRAYYRLFEEMEGLVPADGRLMTDDEVARVLEHGEVLASWINKVVEDATARLAAGQHIPGFKLVEGRGRRQFLDEGDVIDKLIGLGYGSEDMFDTKMKSLTEIEKKLGKKTFERELGPCTTKVPGKHKIVPDSDDRPSVDAASLARDFEEN